ncbi:hypothetical protein D3C83_148280 [compost metagenome]
MRLAAEAKLSVAAVRAGGNAVQERDILSTWASWYDAALESFIDLEVGGPTSAIRADITRAKEVVRRSRDTALAALR